MADKAREWTDAKLAKMEREIANIYSRAEKEMKAKWDAYMKRGEKRISALQNAYTEALKVGDEEIIAQQKERLEKAKLAFTTQNDQYKAMVNSVTLDMAQVNNKARAYVNGELPEIYAKNYSQAMDIVKDMKLDFTLPNEDAIKDRILAGKVKTPFMRTKKFMDIPKDQRWNTKFINSEVLQGILQGEDMRKISNRIFPEIMSKTTYEGLSQKDIIKRNRQAAIRNARTLVTGAENQGKHDSYKDLSDRGIVLKQVWIATGDNRTRDSHLEMDGQEVDIGEPFIAINRDGTESELEYPADPKGDAEQVYNCRCALTTRVIGFRNADGTIREIEKVDKGQDLHDKQIAAEVEKRRIAVEQKTQEKEQTDSTNIFGEKIQFSDAILERHPETKELIENLASEFETKLKEVKIGNPKHTQGGGGTQISGTIVTISNFSDESTTIHEFAHSISMENQTKFGLYDESDFWKEIKKVQRKYKKDVGDDTSRRISTYEYSHKGSDEFFAEAFTQAKMHEMGLELPKQYGTDFTYSEMVLEITRKYFGKR